MEQIQMQKHMEKKSTIVICYLKIIIVKGNKL